VISAPEADVVVIRAGLAGLQCAVTVSELRPRADVVVLESQDVVGGSARWAVGSFTAGGTRWQLAAGVKDSAADHFQDALAMCPIRHPAYGQLLLRTCQRGPGLLADLSDRGISFAGPFLEEPHSQPRMHNAVPAASAVAEMLADRADKLGVTVLTGHAAGDIGRQTDGVFGIDTGERHFLARQLVIASGDESATDPVFPAVNPGATGVAQRLVAARLGAARQQGRLVPWLRTWADGRPRVSPVPSIVRQATMRVAGREFPGTQLLADPLSAGAEPLELIVVADAATSAQTVVCTYPATGYATLTDLVAAGLGRRESADSIVLGPLMMAITLVDGGLVVDDQLRVVRDDGTPLAGVHACGSAALGGITLGGHGHHLLWAVATGERAGEQVAGELP
jgi:succinate dehydrogenase/fumarate reductase flavoprotein subunit